MTTGAHQDFSTRTGHHQVAGWGSPVADALTTALLGGGTTTPPSGGRTAAQLIGNGGFETDSAAPVDRLQRRGRRQRLRGGPLGQLDVLDERLRLGAHRLDVADRLRRGRCHHRAPARGGAVRARPGRVVGAGVAPS
ncbi:hypothetical protein [Kitasatospora purpeofusca]|uniref:hypothetical protein n=1 Tax=Kitasatospora purpeofusca TaxID=67352 RepID=UPI002A59B6D7|nr:hypothetical protein [Kitasatospora purpeofusca]MDY0815836.1 hypothetical protein [Kitasatospora purpeofusca]